MELEITDSDNVEQIELEKKTKMCLAKVKYATEFAAAFFADARMQRPYKCDYCDGWHLTTKSVPNYRYSNKEEN